MFAFVTAKHDFPFRTSARFCFNRYSEIPGYLIYLFEVTRSLNARIDKAVAWWLLKSDELFFLGNALTMSFTPESRVEKHLRRWLQISQ
jgi:hypothetical protein